MIAAVFNRINPYLEGLDSTQFSNLTLSIGLISLTAERLIQKSLLKGVTDGKYIGSLICKVIQAGIVVPTICGGRKDDFPLGAMTLFLSLRGSMYLQNPSWIWIIFNNFYKVELCFILGYWIDRSVRLTEKTGPVMIASSLAINLLSVINIKYDLKHLVTQTETVENRTPARLKRIRLIERYIDFAFPVVLVSWLGWKIYKDIYFPQ